MTKINTYTASGTKSSMTFPKALEEKINMDLLAQAVRVYQDRFHPGLSKVKTRSEVDLTTAKVWRQKGTGRARHGARSAPIFVGGGVAHGPKGVKRTLKMSRKMAKKAFLIALSLKAKQSQLVVVKNISKIEKTKDAQEVINKIVAKEELKKETGISLVITKKSGGVKRAFRNIGNVRVINCESLGVLDVYLGGLLIFENGALDKLVKIKTTAGSEVDGKTRNTEKSENISEGTEKKTRKSVKRGTAKGVRKTRTKKAVRGRSKGSKSK